MISGLPSPLSGGVISVYYEDVISESHCKSVAPILGNADSCDSRRQASSASVEAARHSPACAALSPFSPDSGRPIRRRPSRGISDSPSLLFQPVARHFLPLLDGS